MNIKRVYVTSKGMFWDKVEAEKKVNRVKINGSRPNDPFKLRDLIDLGDLSSLAPNIGTNHDFDDRVEGECTFYGRDRGEEDIAARYFDSFQDYLDNFQDEEYNYILRRDGVWYVSEDNGNFVPLSEAMNSIA